MNIIQKIATGAMLYAALSISPAAAQTLEPIQEKPKKSWVRVSSSLDEETLIRTHSSYAFPGRIQGTTWTELKDEDYFGKTILTRPLGYGFSVRTVSVHNNEPLTNTGLGFAYKVPGLPEGVTLSFGTNAVFVDGDGLVEGTRSIDYFFKQDLPWDLELVSVGGVIRQEIDGQIKHTWIPGETNLTKTLGDIVIGYNGATIPNEHGDYTPSLKHRISIGVKF